MKRIRLFSAALAALLFVFGAWAQTPTGAIEGTITDPSGAVIPNAKVTVTEAATDRAIPLTTDVAGRFVVRNLIPGTYHLKIEVAGFQAKEIRNLLVSSGQVVNGSAALDVGQTGEVVQVSAEAVLVDTSRQTVDSVITSREIQNAPLFSRNFLDLASLAPGVFIRDGGDIDPTKVVAYRTVGVGGRSGTATRVQVDGIDVTDETVGTTVANFSQEAISEFQLTRSSLDPSTSLTSSGAINIITKGGTNDIHGAWFWDYYNQDMGARLTYDQTEALPFKRNRTGGQVGGPFKKDKLFWLASWERTYQTEERTSRNVVFPSLNIDQPFPVGIRYMEGRTDWVVSPSVRMFARWHHDWNLSTGGSAVSPFQNIDWTPTVTVGVDFNRARFTHSYRFGYVNFNNRIESQELKYKFLRTPNGIPYYLSVGPFGAGPNSLAPQATYQDNIQNSYEGSWFQGRHSVRWGFDFRRIMLGGFANFAGPLQVTGTYDAATRNAIAKRGGKLDDPLEYPLEYFSMGPANGFFTLRPAHGLPHGGHLIKRPALFVQDSIKVSRRLTVNLGVRWQYDTGYFSDKSVSREPQLERWIKGASTYPVVPKTLFSPSVGFAWDPQGNGKTVIRGGFYRGYEMNIQNNTMFDEFAMLPNGLGPDLYEIAGVNRPDGTPINIDGKHADGNYEDLIGTPLKEVTGLLGALQAELSSAYANYKFDPKRGKSAFLSSGGLYYGSVIPGDQFKIPYALQWNIGVQRELKPGTVLSVDYLYNHAVGLPFLRWDPELRRDVSTLQVGAARSKIDSVLKGMTVDQWIAANPTRNISSFGLVSDTIWMGRYPDMTRARFTEGGFTKYRALQLSLRGTQRQLGFISNAGWNVSWALGRNQTSGGVGRVEFIAVPPDNHEYNGKRTFGPNGLDFTHILTANVYFGIPGGFRFNSIWSFRTAGPATIGIPNLGGAISGTNFVFGTDLTGDYNGDYVAESRVGQWGRKYKTFKDLNGLIQRYNSTQAGQLTVYGKALASAGLFTEAQLKKLGAVSSTIPLVPEGNPNPFNNLLVTNLRFDRPVKLGRIREGMEFIPYVDFDNFFNHSPAGGYSGLGTTFGSWNFDYANAKSGEQASDLKINRGRINSTRRVMMGLRFVF